MNHVTASSEQETSAGQGAANSSSTLQQPIRSQDLGTVALTPTGDFEAGSYQTFTLTYTAGKYGIDDSGSLRVCFRFAADQSRPQFTEPAKPNYTVVEASNSAVLEARYDPKGNVRPWDRTIYIKVVRGYLEEGDRITLRFGVTDGGSPGMRIQTFCEETFEFRVLVDPIATYNYQTLPVQPSIRIVPGPPARYVAALPTLRRVGEHFSLRLKGEDRWGNPSNLCDAVFRLRASRMVTGLPDRVAFQPGDFTVEVPSLSVDAPGDVKIWLEDSESRKVCQANPLRIVAETGLLPYWADFHGQSEETIGTGSATEYFSFARDRAFLDVIGHQGNDFQITNTFWRHLQTLCREFDEPGRFVCVPGYEWSGNTGLGGDRNVLFPAENRQIRRSSHALLDDQSDLDTDCATAADLFEAFAEHGEWDVVCFAHCGGRYADIKLAHDGRFEKSVEVHSSWGSFEWLLQDAFEMGHRVGVVANSDGHKGRPGASYPGASQFGAIGGLTCLLMPGLTREAVFDCLRKRRHYGTTGGPGGRMIIDVRANFDRPGTLYHDDPALGFTPGVSATEAMMGDIVHLPEGEAELTVDILAAASIERVDLFNGLDLVETLRPYGPDDLGARIRVLWEGAEYRGRFRQVVWDGGLTLSGNRIRRAEPINFFNPDRKLEQVGDDGLRWQALTTGNFGGVDLWLEDAAAGTLKVENPLVNREVPVGDIGLEDMVVDRSGVLPRFLKLFRLPDENPHRRFGLTRRIALRESGDNPIFIRMTQEDGTRAWTSPIYIFR